MNGPIHGGLHTLAGALTIGLIVTEGTYYFKEELNRFLDYLELSQERNKWKILGGGLVGALILHLLLDAFLYSDVEPIRPLTVSNPHLKEWFL
ncbi:MAG: hypothetical protein ABEJ83_02295 [Candidatus Nanohaloarchaea archaeon]